MAAARATSGARRIGFIGTGTTGTPIAGCLIAAGHQLTIHDIRREATRALAAQGATVADTPRAAAAGCEVAFPSLPGPIIGRYGVNPMNAFGSHE